MHWHLPTLFIFNSLFVKDHSIYKLLQEYNLKIAILFLAERWDIHKFLLIIFDSTDVHVIREKPNFWGKYYKIRKPSMKNIPVQLQMEKWAISLRYAGWDYCTETNLAGTWM